MRHAPPNSAGHRICHTQRSFHLKCGEDHDGCHQIHDTLKGSLGSHLGLCDPVHAGHFFLTVSISNFLAMHFWQLLSLALVSLTICVTCFLLPIGLQKRQCVSTPNIFQSNLRIDALSSLSYPLAGIRRNLHIAAHTSLSCPPARIRCMLLLRLSNVPLPGKTILANARVLQRGLLFLFVH
jgi:hypothetical protein